MNTYFKLAVSLSVLFAIEINAYAQQATQKTKSPQLEGFYQNPILGGDYPDPSIVRDGKDYYMTHSSFEYYPGLLVWHSTDLVNWERIAYALNQNVGSVWAP